MDMGYAIGFLLGAIIGLAIHYAIIKLAVKAAVNPSLGLRFLTPSRVYPVFTSPVQVFHEPKVIKNVYVGTTT